MAVSVIYKITSPNGKIYIGQDRTNDINYFGSASGQLIAKDFAAEERRSFTVTREILWEAEDISRSELSKIEMDFIRYYCSNNPVLGYNQHPPFRD